ncbi:OPT-1 protein, partial [Aphelenchoides avenae]
LNVYWLFVGPGGITSSTTKLDKPTKGEGESGLSLALMMPCGHVPASLRTSNNCPSATSTYNGPLALCRVEEGNTDSPCNPRNPKAYYQWTMDGTGISVLNTSLFAGNSDDTSSGSAVSYANRDVQPGRYRLYYVNDTLRGAKKPPRTADELSAAPVGVEFEITGMGGVYLLVVSTDGVSDSNTAVIHTTHTVVPRNHMSILWQLPLYVIITMAETLFAISGYEFAYSQTAPSLKTVTQAIWLLTIGLGDAIIIIITLINTLDLATSDFIFAGGMLLVIGIFALMSVYYYDYVDIDETKTDESASASCEISVKDEDRVVKL